LPKRFSGAGLPYQNDVAFFDLHLVRARRLLHQALVVVVYGHAQHFLSVFLSDHVLIQVGLDLFRLLQCDSTFDVGTVALTDLLGDDVLCLGDAAVADVAGNAGDQHVGVLLVAPAERTLDLFLFHGWRLAPCAEWECEGTKTKAGGPVRAFSFEHTHRSAIPAYLVLRTNSSSIMP
jgi:hypothetical protein